MVPRFTRHWQGRRRAGRPFLSLGRTVAGLALAALLALSGPLTPRLWAQGVTSADLQALASDDAQRQMAAVARLRQAPDAAREALLKALASGGDAGRWRLIYRMVEFGKADDVPLLLKLRADAQDAWERRVAEGAARALYDPAGATTGLEGIVSDFSFIQTRRPKESGRSSGWRISSWSLADYHRDGLPLGMIQRLGALRNKTYRDRGDLAEAMRRQVGPRDWKAHEERLMASVEAVNPTVTLQGLARVRLSNPLDRPLLLSVSLDVWYGQLETRPEPAWVYLPPRGSQTVDLPVAPEGVVTRGQLRMDLRLGEVDGAVIPGFHKLYLPLQS